MAVSKFYAIWRKPSGEEQMVNAFQALELKGQAIIKTSPKEKASLFDVETGLKVTPRRGQKTSGPYQNQPYFSYYPGEDSPLKGTEGTFEYSSELNIFLEAFKDIKKFQIQYGNQRTIIFPKTISLLKRVPFENEEFVVLKLLIELDETYPYSEYYRLNGHLGIEFYKTSRPRPTKRVRLAKKGIPLLEAKAQFPKSVKIVVPDELTSLAQVESIAGKVRDIYENRNYKLYGTFDKYHSENFVFLDDNERKYRQLKSYEEQCQELETEIRQLQDRYNNRVEKLNQLRENIRKAESQLQDYQEKEEYYKKTEKDNERLTAEVNQLESQTKQLLLENDRLQNRSFLQRIFNK